MFRVTLSQLVSAVAEEASSDAEVIATIVHMVNSGAVQLRGKLRGARIDLEAELGALRAA